MPRPAQAVRTLILPYADRNRPDRLYMSRFVYSVLETPSSVVRGYLVPLVSAAARVPVLEQIREVPGSEMTPPVVPARAEPPPCRRPAPAAVIHSPPCTSPITATAIRISHRLSPGHTAKAG